MAPGRPYLIITRQGDLLNPRTRVRVVWDDSTEDWTEIPDFVGVSASWSPVEDALLFSRIDEQSGEWRMSLLSRGDSGPVDLQLGLPSGARPSEPTWSSDGRRIVFVDSRDLSRPIMWLFDRDAEALMQIAEGASPAWAPLSDDIAYINLDKDVAPYGGLGVLNLDTGNTTVVASPDPFAMPMWSNDGKFLLMSALSEDRSSFDVATWSQSNGQVGQHG